MNVEHSGFSLAEILALCSVFSSIVIGVAVIVATYRGPIVAAKQSDERRHAQEKRDRQMSVFRLLMGHRYDVMTPNFVAGLNLVEIEFADYPTVIAALKYYLHAFRERKHEDQSIVYRDRENAVIRLITEIGAQLNYKLDQLNLMQEAYAPQAWRIEEEKQRAVRDLLADIAENKRAFPVMNFISPVFVEESDERSAAIRVNIKHQMDR